MCGKAKGSRFFQLDLLLLITFQVQILAGSDTISQGQILSGDATITSEGGVFEMGLFSPANTHKYYLGIWYKGLPFPEKTVVWVANREQPISDPTSTSLKIAKDGNLVLSSPSGITFWCTNITSMRPLPVNAVVNTVGVLADDGNFILRDTSYPYTVVWESFDQPTDTLLPGGKYVVGTVVRSWKDINDPAPGKYFARFSDMIGVELWNGSDWQYQSYDFYDFDTDFTRVPDFSDYQVYYAVLKTSLVRIVLDVSGQIKLLVCWRDLRRWKLVFPLPQKCAYDQFSSCDQENLPHCRCMVPYKVDKLDFICTMRKDLQCKHEKDGFLLIPNMRYPPRPEFLQVKNSGECRLACLANFSCTAYAYDSMCFIWKEEFSDLQKLSSDEEIGGDFYVRVAASEIKESGNNRATRKKGATTWIVVVVVLISLAGIFVMLKIMWTKLYTSSIEAMGDSLMHFKHQDLRKATKNFTQKIGEGGFSVVYRGEFPNSTLATVKQLKGQIHGDKQFRAELSTIGIIQHKNLARLRGFCLEFPRKFLVYDYMSNGSLESHLFQEGTGILDWAKRYNIAIGTAKGLAYLHESCRDCIIHCDVKPENILLDSDFNPKIADFGLAKLLGRNFNQVLTTMRGTRGYLAPEWFSGEAITAKVDVFSYGQMLFEIISGKRNMNLLSDELTNYFPAVVLNLLNNGGEVVTLLDPKLKGEVNVEELTRACKVACWCIQDHEKDRPTMAQVIQILEGVLHVGVPPIPQFFRSLAEGSLETSDVKGSETYSSSSSLPYSFSFQPHLQPIHHMS